VQHKYTDTALLLCNEVCGAYCRYCFRKRLFMDGNDEVSNDVGPGIEYIRTHPEVNNVLLTGGDPLLMSTRRLREIIDRLCEIPHVRIIRIGSKMPAFNPYRLLDDAELLEYFRGTSTPEHRIYLMAHFDHPVELTDVAVAGLDACLRAGVICVNQCPLIRGVNDRVETLSELFERLSFVGCPPYYLFQGRPTAGNEPFALPIVAGWNLFRAALTRGSGLARRARFAMSHARGKVEVMAVDAEKIYTRIHQARSPEDLGKILIFERDDQAMWLDDLRLVGAA
jgi:KamA family protein